jgi:CDP-6-deoxy-D-xylo-4-hexulose-3-dehydrase
MKKIINNINQVQRKVLYAGVSYDQHEIDAVVQSLSNQWLANGPLVAEFEEKVAPLFGKKYGIAVNSGSSANLLAIASLELPKGGNVITPALTFSTTVSPILINGLVPKFIDGLIGRYTINESQIESAIDEKTVAIMLPQLIGGICDMEEIKAIAVKHNLKVIDDSCDTFAPKLGEKTVASYADVTTTSFYGSHIITALGMGGMLMTDDKQVRNSAIRMRDWGRVGNDQEAFEERFNYEVDGIPYDGKFLYSHLGFNFKMNEAAAAFGLEQLKKIPQFLRIRKQNWSELYEIFSKYHEYFYLPELLTKAETNWLAFPVTVKESSPFSRYELLEYLESDGIQTRVLFSGNITRHPIMKKYEYQISGELSNADTIMRSGFLLGAHHAMTKEQIEIIRDSLTRFMNLKTS